MKYQSWKEKNGFPRSRKRENDFVFFRINFVRYAFEINAEPTVCPRSWQLMRWDELSRGRYFKTDGTIRHGPLQVAGLVQIVKKDQEAFHKLI